MGADDADEFARGDDFGFLPELWEMALIASDQVIAVGGVADHVHVLLSLSRTASVAKAVQLLKAGSSKWLNELGPRGFSWQEGYAAFSVSVSQRQKVTDYGPRAG